MINLLRADFKRLFKSRVTISLAVLYALYALVMIVFIVAVDQSRGGGYGKELMAGVFVQTYSIFGTFPVAGCGVMILAAVLVGADFRNGTIRNKLISGHGRTETYLSSFIAVAVTALAFTAEYYFIMCAVGLPIYGGMALSAENAAWFVFDGSLTVVSYAAVATFLTYTVRRYEASLTIGILAAFAMCIVTGFLISAATQPEFIDEWVGWEADGSPIFETVPNPDKLSPAVEKFLLQLSYVFPSSQCHWYYRGGAPTWEFAAYSGALTVLFSAAGAGVFAKRNLN